MPNSASSLSLSFSATFKKMSPGSRDASSSLSVSTAISEPGVAERVGAFESRGSSSLYLSVVAAEDMKQVVHEGLFSLSLSSLAPRLGSDHP